MSIQPCLWKRTAALLVLVAVAGMTFVGCQNQSEPGGKTNASSQTKKVTVDVTGMT